MITADLDNAVLGGIHPARLLELAPQPGLRRHVLREHRRPVGRADARRVEEILHRQPASGRGVAQLRDEDVRDEDVRVSGLGWTEPPGSIQPEVDEPDADRAGEQDDEQPEQRPAPREVAAGELGLGVVVRPDECRRR